MQILITESCLVALGDPPVGQHVDNAEIIDVNAKTAAELVNACRALYVNASDDKTRGKYMTAKDDELQAAANVRKAREDAEKANKKS